LFLLVIIVSIIDLLALPRCRNIRYFIVYKYGNQYVFRSELFEQEELTFMETKQANATCYIEPTPELKARLSPEEWKVLVEAGTEPPFMNKYWNNHEAGIYFDAVDGTPLFASKSKFESGTGWPSFWAPIDKDSILLVEDRSFGMRRIEVRAKASGGHLGHLFEDGPEPTGKRYCINSAALRFIPVDELEARGYGQLKALLQ